MALERVMVKYMITGIRAILHFGYIVDVVNHSGMFRNLQTHPANL